MLKTNSPRKLSKTLAIYVYLFSSLMTLITTTVQLSINYHAEMDIIEASGKILKQSYLESLKTAAWNFNDLQLQALSNGLEVYPNVSHVSVFMDGKLFAESGKATEGNSILHQWELSSGNNPIGKVLVEISTEAPLESLYSDIKTILFSNFLKMFFIATFIILLVEYLITRHLKHLASDLKQTQSFESLQDKIKLASKRKHPNEIDSVVLAVNLMRSKLKNLWSQLQTSEQNYRQIINNSGQGVLITTEGQSIHYNKEVLKLFDIKSIDNFEQHLKAINKSINTLNKNKNPPSMLEIIIPTEGKQKTIQHFFHNVVWSGKPSIVHFFIDITAIKLLEKKHKEQEAYLIQSNKMNSLGVMVSGITHEINNPNHLIRINIDTLSRIWDEVIPVLDNHHANTPQWKLSNIPYAELKTLLPVAIKDIKQGSIQIQNIISDLKNFIRSKGSVTSFSDCHVDSIIYDVLHILQPHITKHNIHIDYQSINYDLQIEAQQTQLNQVFINLILNAIQSCEDSGKIIITAKQVGQIVKFTVEDNGHGIEANRLDKIFDLFHSSKKDTGGTGIGLAIAFRLIQIHQGEIKVTSKVNIGSIFTVTLPIKQKEAFAQEQVFLKAQHQSSNQ